MRQVFRPDDELELVECISDSVDRNRRFVLVGGGSRCGALDEVEADAILDVSKLSGIVDYDPSELVLTARAGTPLADIEALILDQHQMLGFEPPSMCNLTGNPGAVPTIGGAISANAAGPRRIAAGAARDHFLGFRAVSGRGEVFKSGGRVVKNVTGFDLSKLMAGSWGSLAVLTEVSVKVIPRPRFGVTVMLAGLDVESACKVMAHSLVLPLSVSAAAFLPTKAASVSPVDCRKTLTIFRIEGFPASVAARSRSLVSALRPFGQATELPADLHAPVWKAVAEVDELLPADGPVLRMAMPADASAGYAGDIGHEDWFMDWGGALVWSCGSQVPGTGKSAHVQCWRDRASCPVNLAPDVSQVHSGLIRSLKAKFDPANILNPGALVSYAN